MTYGASSGWLVLMVTSCITWFSATSNVIRINDRSFSQQRHYLGPQGLNVISAWQQCKTGTGITVAVVDDDVYNRHPELRHAIDHSRYQPRTRARLHGTMSAGVIFSSPSINTCGVGVAFNATLQVRTLTGDANSGAEAHALRPMGPRGVAPDVFLCGWGPSETNYRLGHMPGEVERALRRGTTEGRDGKGAVYVWAAGNGGISGNTCAYDGYVQSRYTLAVAGVTRRGHRLRSGERCSAIMAAAPSQDNGEQQGFPTTDGTNRCFQSFSDSSLASALGAGVMALVLQANPSLTWRDVQHLVAETSTTHGLQDGAWSHNLAGKQVSPYFGFGRLNAGRLVARAVTWNLVPAEESCTVTIPEFQLGYRSPSHYIQFNIDDDCPITRLEHVTTNVNLTYAARGHIGLDLIHQHDRRSTRSTLLAGRRTDVFQTRLEWSVDSVAFWGENPKQGSWRLQFSPKFIHTLRNRWASQLELHNVSVTLYGTRGNDWQNSGNRFNHERRSCSVFHGRSRLPGPSASNLPRPDTPARPQQHTPARPQPSRPAPNRPTPAPDSSQPGQTGPPQYSYRFIRRATNRTLVINATQTSLYMDSSLPRCQQMCREEDECHSITYMHGNRQRQRPRCFLNAVAYNNPAIRNQPVNTSTVTVEIYDKVGFVLRAINRLLRMHPTQYTLYRDSNLSACLQMCAGDEQCRSITYMVYTSRCSLNFVAYNDPQIISVSAGRDMRTKIYNKIQN